MIKLAIFDLDGTLLDTLDTITYYVNKTLQKYGIKPYAREELRPFIGKGARNLITRALEARGALESLDFDELFAYYNAEYDASPYYLTHPYEGIPELIEELKGAGISLAVLSNKPEISTRACIEHFFRGFDIIRGGRAEVPLKPAPDALYSIMDELSVTPMEVAYIGDSEVDIETMKNAPVAIPISVTWGLRTTGELKAASPIPETVFCDTPSEVYAVITR